MKHQQWIPWWQVLGIAALMPIRPVWAMNRLDPQPPLPHVPRASRFAAFIVHIVLGLVVAMVATGMVIYAEMPYPATFNAWLHKMLRPIAELPYAFIQNGLWDWLLIVLGVMLFFLGSQLALFLLGACWMSWLPRVEGLTQATWTGCKRLWLAAAMPLSFAVLWGIPATSYARYSKWWWTVHYDPKEIMNFDWSERPWLLQHPELLGLLFFAAGAFALWWLMRAMASGAVRPRCVWPALCQRCGYGLPGMTVEQSCPECGTSVNESIGSQRNAPSSALWHRSNPLTTLLCFVFGPLYRSRQWGQKLRLYDPDPTYRWALVQHGLLAIPLATLLMALSFLIASAWESGLSFDSMLVDIYENLGLFMAMCLITGLLWMIALWLFSIALGSIFGLIASWFFRVNLMPAAGQASAYVAGVLNTGVAMVWTVVIVLILISDNYVLDALADMLRIDTELIVFSIMLLAAGPALWRYIYCVSRMTLGMRWSNQ